MPKKSFFDEEVPPMRRLDYIDGFRFGFGMFIGWLVGLLIVGGSVAVISRLLNLF
jgi:hypothetical protein